MLAIADYYDTHTVIVLTIYLTLSFDSSPEHRIGLVIESWLEHSISECLDILCEDSITSDIRQGVRKLGRRECNISIENPHKTIRKEKMKLKAQLLTKLVDAGVSMI